MTDTEEDLLSEVSKLLQQKEQAKRDQEFADWCAHLEAIPANHVIQLKDGLCADLELQPMRWISAGMDLLRSSNDSLHVQLSGGIQGPPINSTLFYPVFQAGCEFFLKGMWLCQEEACRQVAHNDYVAQADRNQVNEGLKKLSHDLLKILDAVCKIPEYQNDATTMQFLRRLEGLIRGYYFPLYTPYNKATSWAFTRYPVRFYNDAQKIGKANALTRLPQQRVIVRLFEPMSNHIDQLWGLTAGLAN